MATVSIPIYRLTTLRVTPSHFQKKLTIPTTVRPSFTTFQSRIGTAFVPNSGGGGRRNNSTTSMAQKDLFILVDGTSNSPEAVVSGTQSKTNVQVLRDEFGGRKLLDADLEQGWEIRPLVNHPKSGLVFYDRGLGSPRLDNTGKVIDWSFRPSSFFQDPLKVYSNFVSNLDMMNEQITAFGIMDNVAQAYRFLVENYDQGAGDRVFMFGFSRGSYTLRLLLQLIRYFGLVRRDRLKADPRLIEQAFLLYNSNVHPQDNTQIQAFRSLNCLAGANHHENVVHFLGLFDTARGKVIERVHEDPRLNSVVRRARHAVSIDEIRPDFKPEIWTKNPTANTPTDFQQRMFAGVHSDIGGGYKERGLANVTLNWMVQEAGLNHTYFAQKYPPDPLAMQHDSYKAKVHQNMFITWEMVSQFEQYHRLKNIPTDAENLEFHPQVFQRCGKTVRREAASFVYPQYPRSKL